MSWQQNGGIKRKVIFFCEIENSSYDVKMPVKPVYQQINTTARTKICIPHWLIIFEKIF